MKKVFKMTALAVMVMGLATACNQGTTEEKTDSTAPDTTMPVVEEVTDSIIDSSLLAEEPEPVKATTTKASKKAEPQKNVRVKQDISNEPTLTPVNEGNSKMNMREGNKLEASNVTNTGNDKRGAKTGKMRK